MHQELKVTRPDLVPVFLNIKPAACFLMAIIHLGSSAHSGREHRTRPQYCHLTLPGPVVLVPAAHHNLLVILGTQHLEDFPMTLKAARSRTSFHTGSANPAITLWRREGGYCLPPF